MLNVLNRVAPASELIVAEEVKHSSMKMNSLEPPIGHGGRVWSVSCQKT